MGEPQHLQHHEMRNTQYSPREVLVASTGIIGEQLPMAKVTAGIKKAAGKLDVILEKNLDDSGCPSRVNTEAISWVLDQIIVNALEVSPRGKTIQIRSHRSGENCLVEIEDEGSGIKSEHLPNIFKPFFTTKKNGHGLALSASRKIMQDMGGDIQVAGEKGKGAKFTVSIPRESIPGSTAAVGWSSGKKCTHRLTWSRGPRATLAFRWVDGSIKRSTPSTITKD